MPGNAVGGKKAAQTNMKRHGADFYTRVGSLGGQARVPKGFAVNRDLARTAGSKGGKVSKRGGNKNGR